MPQTVKKDTSFYRSAAIQLQTGERVREMNNSVYSKLLGYRLYDFICLLPTIFFATFETLLRDNDIPHGMSVDGKFLQQLLFADDVVLLAQTPKALETINCLNMATQTDTDLYVHAESLKYYDMNLKIIESNFIINYIHQSRSVTLHDIIILLFSSKAITVKTLTNELSHP